MIAAIPFIQKLRLLLVVLCCLLTTPAFATTVVEFYNTNLDNYFITADANEAEQIDSGSAGPGWSRTGNSFSSGGSTSVCRFYGSQSPGPNSHFYTVDAAECADLKQLQASTPDTQKRWNYESLDFVSTPPSNGTCPGGTVQVYRAYNNGNSRGIDSNHRITSNTTAIQEVVNRGWNNEGVVMCAPPPASYVANLPSDPGTAATATLKGVDTNSNHVRDEVERTASASASTKDSWDQTMAAAASFQSILETKNSTQAQAQAKAAEIYCKELGRSDTSKNEMPTDLMLALTYDTPERWREYSSYLLLFGATVTDAGAITCN